MPDRWIIRVAGKEYGPVDLDTLIEWKREGRLLSGNEARPEDESQWSIAGAIPGLFRPVPSPAVESEVIRKQARLPRGKIPSRTFQIYAKGFLQFMGLTALVTLPSICAQFLNAFAERSLSKEPNFVGLISGASALFMMVLLLVLWPVYLAGLQIVTGELAAGGQIGLGAALNRAAKFWPRVATLCLLVYGVFFFLLVFAFGIALMTVGGVESVFFIVLVLTLLAIQIWLFGRWFINVLFWQQAAVLNNASVAEALRQSKELARSRHDLPWYNRPLWRGALIASIWCAFVIALELCFSWTALFHSFQLLITTTDPQSFLAAMKANSTSHGLDMTLLLRDLLQAILRPLLGIAFVLLYLDARTDLTESEVARPTQSR